LRRRVEALGIDFGSRTSDSSPGRVGKAGAGSRRILLDFGQVAADVEKFLRGRGRAGTRFHGSSTRFFLFLGFDFGELGFFERRRGCARAFRGDDGLLNEEALLAAADRAAANFVAGVATVDGVEARLLLASF